MSLKFPSFEELFSFSPKASDNETHVMSVTSDFQNYSYPNSQTFSTKLLNVGYINNYLTNKIKDYGSYIIIVNSENTNGPTAIFCISRSNCLSNGSINKLVQSYGTNGDCLELDWNPGEYPLLKYNQRYIHNSFKDKNKGAQVKINFFVKVLTAF